MSFLQAQGVAATRMAAEGYGKRVPVADNSTPAGRAKNRRVEIILAEGVIQGAGQLESRLVSRVVPGAVARRAPFR